MPKGALLHAHLDAMVNAKTLLELALKQPAMHVRAPAVLCEASLASTLPTFRALPAEEIYLCTGRSLTASSYEPDAWVPLAAARENFDPALGGPAGFDAWVIGALTINPIEAYQTHNTVEKVGYT